MSIEPGLSDGVATEEPQSARDRADATRRGLEAAFNHGDFSGVREFTSSDAISHDPTMSRALQAMRGVEPFVRQVSTYRDAFPDLRFEVEDTIAEGDRVAVRWRAEGTHRGRLQGLAPTGVHASTTGISINRWQGGKAVESWVQWDNLGLARQIGAAPAEGSVPERLATAAQQLIARRMRRRTGG
jgi:predicted ester cyclase